MKNRKLPGIIITILILITLILIGMVLLLRGRVEPNPTGTVGNTAGNLYNRGLFCEQDGMVYFSNPYDHGTLYSMDIAEDHIQKLRNVPVQNLLIGGSQLYYFQTGSTHASDNVFTTVGAPNSLNRCGLDGSKSTALKTGVILGAQLVDNSLYVMLTDNGENIFLKMDTDGSNELELTTEYILPASAENGIIYYTDPKEHFLSSLNTTTDAASKVLSGNIWFPDKKGDFIYYIDANNNYSLNKYSISQNTIQILTDEWVDFYNVGNDYIYYQTAGNNPCLKFMSTDGTGQQVLAEGAFHNINLTSTYVYFQQYGVENMLYHAFMGSSAYTEFQAAKDAVKE